jgi:hypothetical protein
MSTFCHVLHFVFQCRWNQARHLVPVLDLINCKEGPDATRVHHTQAEIHPTGASFAITKAGWAFPAGAQVFENYGQPNWIYFLYHGFSLTKNSRDCANVILSMGPLMQRLNKTSFQVRRAT